MTQGQKYLGPRWVFTSLLQEEDNSVQFIKGNGQPLLCYHELELTVQERAD